MLHLHTSNRLEHLAQDLATVIKEPLAHPLAKEIIVVQSLGMQRWISMTLAAQLGVWANGWFPFPDTLLWRVFKDTLGYLPETSQFDREVMAWSLIEILPSFLTQPEFAELHSYLQQDEKQIKHFQLAWRIAEIFDQYVVYRPQWLAYWENDSQPPGLKNDPQAAWQAMLWRALVKRYGPLHQAKLRADFFKKLRQRNLQQKLFQRICVFGISALPPFHLEVLAELGHIVAVHIFLLNPCQEYWGDIVSDGEMARRLTRLKNQKGFQRTEPKQLEDLFYFETGNSLLASLGKMGRDFIDLLTEYPYQGHESFADPGSDTLLNCIQSDILHLRERSELKPIWVHSDDHSIQIHVCHSAMREIEVLHDQLLALFEAQPTLLPKEILVMMPEIEVYAPFIQAVFDTVVENSKKIPYTIADRSLRHKSVLIDTFFAILELSHSRFSVSQVLAILEVTAVQKRFNLLEQDLDLIRYWIDKTGIRWGMDKTHRERWGSPAFEEHTWRAGLNRLLLGYALPQSPIAEASEDCLFQGILPFDEIEGSETLILGKLFALVETLFESIQALEQPRTLPEWSVFLTELLDRFLQPDEDSEPEVQQIRSVLTQLVEVSQRAQFQQPVTQEVILAYLRHYLEKEPQPTDFLTGHVTFSTLRPMRSIPFKVICLLGLNDQAYPRSSKPLSFDLMAQNPRKGDRSRRQNDRYLFLEALLSVREHFYISYVGQSIRDNSVMPPSVLVNELLDYISQGFIYSRQELLAHLVTYHPLQAFSPRYFNDIHAGLFSFSAEYCTVGQAMFKERQATRTFFIHPLPTPKSSSVEWKTVDINQLTRFFKNPSKFLLMERLGIQLPNKNRLMNETEPFEIQGLHRYHLNQQLVEKQLEGIDLKTYQMIAKASGQLPHGIIGDYVYSQLIEQVQPFINRVRAATKQKKLDALMIDLTIDDMRITGRLNRLWHDNLVHYRCAKQKSADLIPLWIHHLILNHVSNNKLPRYSVLINEDKTWTYEPVQDSDDILRQLLMGYWQGLIEPLHFFPETSFTFVDYLKKGASEEEAFDRAWYKWWGNDYNLGEIQDDYYRLCFGMPSDQLSLMNSTLNAHSPLDEHFKQQATQFFKPLLDHQVHS